MRSLVVDIETRPNLAYVWGTSEYEQQYRRGHLDQCRAYEQKYRSAHRAEIRAKNSARARGYGEWLRILTATHDCVLCGGAAEHWHHVDPTTKRKDVAGMHGYSLDSIEAELEKCVPMCASCHGEHHRKQQLEVRHQVASG